MRTCGVWEPTEVQAAVARAAPPFRSRAARRYTRAAMLLSTAVRDMMPIFRTALAALFAIVTLYATSAIAQDYPTRPVTIVVPIAAGTGMDLLVRLYAEPLAQALGKPLAVENRPGAGLTLAPSSVATAPPDGHTLMPGVTRTLA